MSSIFQIKRGQHAPGIDDLELWQLGYSYETKSLYIKEKAADDTISIIQFNSGGMGGGGASQVFQETKENSEISIDNFIAAWTEEKREIGFTFLPGDLLVIKIPMVNNLFEHFAYVYDTNGNWLALTRNYSSESVYFPTDLQTTVPIGNITIPSNGVAIIEAAGKNLNQVWNEIFVKEMNPTVTQPSIVCDIDPHGYVEVGTWVDVTWSGNLKPGKYSYGPETGVTFSNIVVTDTLDNTSSNSSGIFNSIEIKDNTRYSITISAEHSDGVIPLTNLGKPYNDGKITAGTKTGVGGTLIGYRKCFYGAINSRVDSVADLSSDLIRNLDLSTSATLTKGTTLEINVNIGDICTIIAYPETLGNITEIIDVTGMNTTVTTSFTKYTYYVDDASGGNAIAYNVYTNSISEPYTEEKKFKITI